MRNVIKSPAVGSGVLVESIEKDKKIFFVGINGIGMSGVAMLFEKSGYSVAGSCDVANKTSFRLEEAGVKVVIGHDASNIDGCDVVVFGSAIKDSNPELVEARRRGIPLLHRSAALAALFGRTTVVGVMGSHGKTTISSLVSSVMYCAKKKINAAIGGVLPLFGWNGHFDEEAEFFVVEMDESDGSLLNMRCDVALINNLSEEHLDVYDGKMENVFKTFVEFLDLNCGDKPRVVLCQDDALIKEHILPKAQELVAQRGGKLVTFGLKEGANFVAKNVRRRMEGGSSFDLFVDGKFVLNVQIPLYGLHNVANCLGALATLDLVGVDLITTGNLMKDFLGVDRRFSVVYQDDDIVAVDDYAHHPREIGALLKGAGDFLVQNDMKRIVCVLQPHRYSRVAGLMDDYVRVFADIASVAGVANVAGVAGVAREGLEAGDCCDDLDGKADILLVVMPIYAAGEPPVDGVTNDAIVTKMLAAGVPSVALKGDDMKSVFDLLKNTVRPSDLLLFVGAGSVSSVARGMDFKALLSSES